MRRLLAAIVGNRSKDSPRRLPVADAAQLLRTARTHFDAGRIPDAEGACREALRLDPANFEALYMLGTSCQQSGRLAEAIRWLREATRVRPQEASARNLLGVTFARSGDLPAARVEFERAIEAHASNVDALNNLGNVLKDSGEPERAVGLYRRALELRPALPATLNNLGLTLHQLGRLEEAESAYTDAVRLQPTHVDAITNLGVLKQAQGNAKAAEHCFRAAIGASPAARTARCNLAALLLETAREEEAVEHCKIVLATDPGDPDALDVMALVRKQRGELAEAEALCRGGLARFPQHISLRITLGTVLNGQGRLDDARACFEDVVARAPASAAARYNLATLALLHGDYLNGFGLYESRFDAFRADVRSLSGLRTRLARIPRWRGEPVAAKRVLIWAEQGFGDAIMMMRFLPLLKGMGAAQVTVLCDPVLARLMAVCDGVDRVIHDLEASGADTADLHCPMMSLPNVFATRHDAVPPPCVPHVPPALVERWRAYLSPQRRPLIGICWKGSQVLRDDAQRSIAPADLASLLAGGQQFVSLQKERAEEADQLPGLLDPMARCHDFLDTAALILALDAVVSVDTAVAHLAATLGKPVLLLNRHASEWRWGLAEGTSAWYPTLTILRQRTPGDWRETLARAGAELRRLDLASS